MLSLCWDLKHNGNPPEPYSSLPKPSPSWEYLFGYCTVQQITCKMSYGSPYVSTCVLLGISMWNFFPTILTIAVMSYLRVWCTVVSRLEAIDTWKQHLYCTQGRCFGARFGDIQRAVWPQNFFLQLMGPSSGVLLAKMWTDTLRFLHPFGPKLVCFLSFALPSFFLCAYCLFSLFPSSLYMRSFWPSLFPFSFIHTTKMRSPNLCHSLWWGGRGRDLSNT